MQRGCHADTCHADTRPVARARLPACRCPTSQSAGAAARRGPLCQHERAGIPSGHRTCAAALPAQHRGEQQGRGGAEVQAG